MILYHGSNVEINKIDFSKCRPYKDFGQGFYTTTISDQALKMANRVSRIYGGTPVVTVFEFDEEAFNSDILQIKLFSEPTKEWALFVINNRNRYYTDTQDPLNNHDGKYDIVVGPIANDDLALLFRQFTNNMINIDTLVREMEFKKLTDQYSFHSEESLSFLKKIGVQQ